MRVFLSTSFGHAPQERNLAVSTMASGMHTPPQPLGAPGDPQDLRTRAARVGESLVVLGDLAVPLIGDKLQVESSGRMFGAVEPVLQPR